MSTTNLPALTAVRAQPGHTAALSISTGRRVTVATADRALFAPVLGQNSAHEDACPQPGVLIVHGKGYAVPADLFAELRQALKLEGVGA